MICLCEVLRYLINRKCKITAEHNKGHFDDMIIVMNRVPFLELKPVNTMAELTSFPVYYILIQP